MAEELEIQELDTDHDNVFKEPYAQIFAERLKAHLSEAQRNMTARPNSSVDLGVQYSSKSAESVSVDTVI